MSASLYLFLIITCVSPILGQLIKRKYKPSEKLGPPFQLTAYAALQLLVAVLCVVTNNLPYLLPALFAVHAFSISTV